MRDRWHDVAQLKRHDLARHIAGHCGNKICTSVRLALNMHACVILSISNAGAFICQKRGYRRGGAENTGPSHRDWTMQNWNTTDQITRLENAGPENDKRNLINQTLQMK